MRRSLFFMSTIVIFLCAATIWGATWYVDGWDGLDTNSGMAWNQAFKTIRRALNRCSNGDRLEMWGEFVEAPWDSTYDNSIGAYDWDDDEVIIQISVDKSNITLTNYSTYTPTIYGYSPGAPDETVDYIMRIDKTNNTIENILFDGYYDDVSGGDVYTHDVIFMTPEADYTEISNCDFTHFGWEWNDPYYFYGIVTGGWNAGNTDELTNITVSNNYFYENYFETQGAHEFYISKSYNGTFSGNDITNNGEGHPLKLRNGCHNITFNSNTVRGAHYCFLGDYPEPGESDSYDIIVTNNTFSDPNSVIDISIYKGPFRNYHHYPFISQFSGNTVVEAGNITYEVKGITTTTNGEKLYMAIKNNSDNYLNEFGKHDGPIISGMRQFPDNGYICDGSICNIGNYVIISTKNGSNIMVYKYSISDSTYSTLLSSTTSSYEITAMCSYNSSYFITAMREYNSGNGVWYARIYKSTSSDLFSHKIYDQPETTVNSVTAVAVTGSTLIFGADLGSSSYKIYSGTIPSSDLINPLSDRESLSYKVTGLTYLSSTLMTAINYGGATRIYSGSTTDPISSIGSYVENFSNTNLISLKSDSYFIFMVKDNTGDADEKRTIYFTDSTSNIDKDIIYHSKWYTEIY